MAEEKMTLQQMLHDRMLDALLSSRNIRVLEFDLSDDKEEEPVPVPDDYGHKVKMEVRCCCDGHLQGHLPVPVKLLDNGKMLSFAFADKSGSLPLELAVFNAGDGHLALKSKDYPIETLRKVKNFVETSSDATLRDTQRRALDKLNGVLGALELKTTAV